MRTSYLAILSAALAFGSPALAQMIVASPGVTLTQAAQAHFNNGGGRDEQIVTPPSGSSGIPVALYSAAGTSADEGWTLQRVAAAKFSRDGLAQGKLPKGGTETTVSLAYGQDRDYSRLAASAGLSPAEAAGMSFDEIANVKLNLDH